MPKVYQSIVRRHLKASFKFEPGTSVCMLDGSPAGGSNSEFPTLMRTALKVPHAQRQPLNSVGDPPIVLRTRNPNLPPVLLGW